MYSYIYIYLFVYLFIYLCIYLFIYINISVAANSLLCIDLFGFVFLVHETPVQASIDLKRFFFMSSDILNTSPYRCETTFVQIPPPYQTKRRDISFYSREN